MMTSILDTGFLKAVRSSIGEINESSDVSYYLEYKAVVVTSYKKFMEFLENVDPRDNPNLFLFSVRDEAAQRKKIQRKLDEKFPTRPLILEFVDEVFFKETGEFGKVADQMSGVGKLLKDFHSLSEENFVEEVKNSLNVLSIRLLNIFEIPVASKIEIFKRILEKPDDINLIHAVLDLPFGYPSPVLSPSSEKIIKTCINDDSVLEVAIRSQNERVCSFLINNFKKPFNHLGFHWKQRVSNLALKTKLSIFSSLIENGFPFPENFDNLRFDIEVVNKRRELHDALDNKNVEKVKELASRKGIYYDFLNRSLLRRALETEQFELYVFLKAQGFIFGENGENDVEILKDTIRTKYHKQISDKIESEREKIKKENTDLSDEKIEEKLKVTLDEQIKKLLAPYKERIDELTLKYATPNDRKFSKVLASRSYIHDRGLYESEVDRTDDLNKIEELFEELNSIEKIRPLLKIVAAASAVEFHFDFFEVFIHNIVIGKDTTMGVAYRNKKLIIIGAKNHQIALGTLAHEMAHVAMLIVYENDWLPYCDKQREDDFDAVYLDCLNKWENDYFIEDICTASDKEKAKSISENIVPWVFGYDNKLWLRKAELIVRAPHMYAYFKDNNEKLQRCRHEDYYKSLFDYYDTKVFPDLENFKAEGLQLTKDLNHKIGVLTPLNIEMCMTNFLNISSMNCHIVSTKAPKLALADIHGMLKLYYSDNILFIDPTKFEHQTIKNDYKKYLELVTNPKIVVDLSDDASLKDIQEVFSPLNDVRQRLNKTVKYVVITHPSKSEEIRDMLRIILDNKPTSVSLDIYDWSFLTHDSQELIKSKRVKFQDKEKKLSDLIIDDNIFDEEFIDACLSNELTVNPIQESNEVYIDRKLCEKDQTPVEKFSESESLKVTENSKIVIISNEAGCGKSQTLKKIQQSIDGLVYLMDLKEIFGKLKNLEGSLDFKKCFASTFIGNRSTFERKLFGHLYDKQKVIVLFDGYDEVYPDCETQVTDLVNRFTGKQLWITTRDHLELELRGKLTNSPKVFTLVELTPDERQKLFEDYMKSQNVETENYKNTAKALDKKLHHGLSDSIENPYLIKLFVDSCIVDNTIVTTDLDQFTKFDIYKKALRRKLESWVKEKGENAFKMSVMTQAEDESFVKVHRFYAMKQALPDVDLDDFEIFIRNWTPEEVMRCGIITRFADGCPWFQHSTLGDFYVADFVIYGVKNSKVLLEDYFKLLLRFLHDPQNFYVVNMFISGGLKDQNLSTKRIQTLSDTLEKIIIETGKFEKIFVKSILENYKSFYEFLLKLFAKVSDEAKVKQLERELKFQPKDVEFKSANEFFISRTENFEKIMKSIIDAINDDNTRDKLLEMLQRFMEDMRRNSIIAKELQKIVVV